LLGKTVSYNHTIVLDPPENISWLPILLAYNELLYYTQIKDDDRFVQWCDVVADVAEA